MSYGATGPRAPSIRPLLEGDKIGDLKVRGFGWKAPLPEQRSSHHDDRLLADGDESLPLPPDRPVPQTAEGAVAAAPMPPHDLDPAQVHRAATVDADIARRAEALLDLPNAPWRPMIRPLFAAVHATGHRLWLAGGAVRDVVSGVPPEKVKDLDMSGTTPTGRFADVTYQALRAAGMSEYCVKVSPSSLVCAVVAPKPGGRVIEYRGLSLGGFRYPAVGSRLAEDARHRDYSFNALLYDVLEHEIYDPSGHGLADLLGPVRRFRPLSCTHDPLKLADMVVRAMKFALRWSGQVVLDPAPLHAWLATVPVERWSALTEQNWHTLRRKRREDIPQPIQMQMEFAATLPESGRVLLERLFGGA